LSRTPALRRSTRRRRRCLAHHGGKVLRWSAQREAVAHGAIPDAEDTRGLGVRGHPRRGAGAGWRGPRSVGKRLWLSPRRSCLGLDAEETSRGWACRTSRVGCGVRTGRVWTTRRWEGRTSLVCRTIACHHQWVRPRWCGRGRRRHGHGARSWLLRGVRSCLLHGIVAPIARHWRLRLGQTAAAATTIAPGQWRSGRCATSSPGRRRDWLDPPGRWSKRLLRRCPEGSRRGARTHLRHVRVQRGWLGQRRALGSSQWRQHARARAAPVPRRLASG